MTTAAGVPPVGWTESKVASCYGWPLVPAAPGPPPPAPTCTTLTATKSLLSRSGKYVKDIIIHLPERSSSPYISHKWNFVEPDAFAIKYAKGGTALAIKIASVADANTGCTCLQKYSIYQDGNNMKIRTSRPTFGNAQLQANQDFYCASKCGDCGSDIIIYRHRALLDQIEGPGSKERSCLLLETFTFLDNIF